MPTEPPAIQPIFCRGCTYPLDVAVATRRCPECGRGFDPADPRSYLGTEELAITGSAARFAVSPLVWLFGLMPVAVTLDLSLVGPATAVLELSEPPRSESRPAEALAH